MLFFFEVHVDGIQYQVVSPVVWGTEEVDIATWRSTARYTWCYEYPTYFQLPKPSLFVGLPMNST